MSLAEHPRHLWADPNGEVGHERWQRQRVRACGDSCRAKHAAIGGRDEGRRPCDRARQRQGSPGRRIRVVGSVDHVCPSVRGALETIGRRFAEVEVDAITVSTSSADANVDQTLVSARSCGPMYWFAGFDALSLA